MIPAHPSSSSGPYNSWGKTAGLSRFFLAYGVHSLANRNKLSCSVFVYQLWGKTVELSGSEIVVQFLKDEGVEYIFGYPGGAVLHIYDAIHQQDDVKHILVRHEQAAAHAADGV